MSMINTGIGQRCDSESLVSETTSVKGCLLHGIIKRISQIKYPMCQRSQINLLYQSQFRNNSSSNCCKPTFKPAKIDRCSRQPVGLTAWGAPVTFSRLWKLSLVSSNNLCLAIANIQHSYATRVTIEKQVS